MCIMNTIFCYYNVFSFIIEFRIEVFQTKYCPRMQRGKTGGNMEPMPFVRKCGSEAEGNEFEGQISNGE
jgi:hypothetical protein